MNDPNQTHRARQVGPYRLLRQIGVGAMGEIYLVQHAESEERFALKRIRGDFADEEELIRFRREAELVARLQHPHVVRLHDSNFATAHPYQVYDLYEGGTLQDRIQRQGSLPLEEALEIANKLGQALSHAHSQGVLHRDLKPENILFDAQGKPALADFGLARRSVSQGNSLTATGEAIGTPVYMAPEQVLDSKRVDERADLYGLAAITYAMLSGGPPIVGANTVLDAFDKVINQPPPPLTREDIPPGVGGAVRAARAKAPDERPPSVAAWLKALEAGQRGGAAPRALLLALSLAALALAAAGLFASGVVGSVGSASPSGGVPEAGVSLLLSCTWEGDELRVLITRGRGVEEGQIWDTVWEPNQKHLIGLSTGTLFWTFSRGGQLLKGGRVSNGATFPEVAGGALARCLEEGAAGALFRLLAQQAPDEGTRVRRASWSQDHYTWEPLVWGEWIDGGPKRGPIDLSRRPEYLIGLLRSLDLPKDRLRTAMSSKNWPGALTHNLCRNLEGKFFPEDSHFALPQGYPVRVDPIGSTLLEALRPVFSRQGGAILGHSPPRPTRYLVFRKQPGWLLIGWGGGLAWTRGDSCDEKTGLMFRYNSILSLLLNPEPSLNVRQNPHFPGQDWKRRLGASPVIGQIPLARLYPFLGVVGGPPDSLEVKNPVHQLEEISEPPARKERKISRRWVKIQFDDRVGWVAWWADQVKLVDGKKVRTRPTLGEFVYPN